MLLMMMHDLTEHQRASVLVASVQIQQGMSSTNTLSVRQLLTCSSTPDSSSTSCSLAATLCARKMLAGLWKMPAHLREGIS